MFNNDDKNMKQIKAERAQVAAAIPGQEPHVNVPWTGEHALTAFRQLNENRRQQQGLAFPLGDNLLALIFVNLADLTQDQRNTLTSIMTHRGRRLDQYNVQELRDLFLEMFCTTKTAVDNPMMQPSGIGQRRSFLVLEEGELEGTDGYWAEDDEDGPERFLDAFEDVFWVYDDADYTWYQRRFQGRQTRRGKGKGKRKGKGKCRGGRRFFRSRKGKGRGKRRKGRSHMVSEEGGEDEWNEGDEWNDHDPHDGYWADDQNWNEGYWAYEDLYYLDEYGYFQRKGKGKGQKGKDDVGKGGKPEDGKGKSNYVQPQISLTPAIHNQQQQQAHYSSASSSGHGFFAMAETEPAYVDVLTATYAEQKEYRRTRRGGQNQRDAVAKLNRSELRGFLF